MALHPRLGRPKDQLGRERPEVLQMSLLASTSASWASPSTPPSHFSPARIPSVPDRGMTVPNDCRVLRRRRVVTRIWCTESGSSPRTSGSSDPSRSACSLR